MHFGGYMVEKESEWILPEVLERQELQYRQSECPLPEGDFSSYKLLDRGVVANSNLEFHNCMGDAAQVFTKILKAMVVKYELPTGSIADMGAGAGFVANEMSARFPNSKVYTYEISRDAVSFSKKNFPRLNAFQMTIAPTSCFGSKFDLIYAKEFYPFTRTNSYEFQKSYIDTFLCNITSNGVLVFILLKTRLCLLNNLESLKKDFPSLIVELVPAGKIYKWIPFLKFAQYMTRILNFLRRRSNAYMFIIKKGIVA
jgi:hypothetical protein